MTAPLSPEWIAPFGRTGDLGDDFRKANDHGYGNGEYVMLHTPEIIRSIGPFTLQVCMSRFEITLRRGEETDDKATIGYDPPLRTFFLQGFDTDDDFGTPEIWFGTLLEEFSTLEGLIEAIRARGYEVRNVGQAAIVAMLGEAGQKYEPTIAERIGLIQ